MANILYVEDKIAWHHVIARIVQSEGHNLTIASDEDQARTFLESRSPEHRFNLIILDLSLREWSVEYEGIDLMDLTDKKVDEQGAVVIVLTGTADPERSQLAAKSHKIGKILDKSDFGRGDELRQIIRGTESK